MPMSLNISCALRFRLRSSKLVRPLTQHGRLALSRLAQAPIYAFYSISLLAHRTLFIFAQVDAFASTCFLSASLFGPRPCQ